MAANNATAWSDARSALIWWNWASRMSEIWWTRTAGRDAIEAARTSRLASLIAYTRERSPFYRAHWRALPQRDLTLSELPVATKRELMENFDRWSTDRAVTRDRVDAFLDDRTHIGSRFLDRYVVWKSSGSTGEPGIFVQEEFALSTYDALVAVQLAHVRLAGRYAHGVITQGARAALIAALGDHFASIASWQRVCRGRPWPNARAFSVMDPVLKIVAELNAYQPAFLASYPTMLAQLAEERATGRLHIEPSCMWSGGEYLAPAAAAEIERAFGCALINEYGSSECMSIAFSCSERALHVNSDWVILEPVDRDFSPTPPGAMSHTVLLTNLANRVHPVIRYDLGDSVIVRTRPCRCGSPLPAIDVEGRCDDVVSLSKADGSVVKLMPLALTTVVEEAADIYHFQIVQYGPECLKLRFAPCAGSRRQRAWHAAENALQHYLATHSLDNVRVVLDRSPPVPDARSGKLREVIVEAPPR
jgi:phenylacetate-coenzyme A ligase PaaK-like adenylate-forming protein